MGIVKHPVELAAQFSRRADYVLANDVLRDVAKQQNEALQEALNVKNGDMLLDGRFFKYGDFFLDMENDLKPMGLLAVANNLFLKKYQDDHSLMRLFTKGDKE